jgi:hypothetical protein
MRIVPIGTDWRFGSSNSKKSSGYAEVIGRAGPLRAGDPAAARSRLSQGILGAENDAGKSNME